MHFGRSERYGIDLDNLIGLTVFGLLEDVDFCGTPLAGCKLELDGDG